MGVYGLDVVLFQYANDMILVGVPSIENLLPLR